MVPKDSTVRVVEHELEGANTWANRYGVSLRWYPDKLELHVAMEQASTGDMFYLLGRFDDYREEPPEWLFCDERWVWKVDRKYFPQPQSASIGSTFLSSGPKAPVICAPFNRLAYAEHDGPHDDWGGPAQWITPKGGWVYAVEIGDMLQAIRRDLNASKGRME